MVDKKNIKNIYGLSPMQEGMLMHSVYGNSPLAYFEQTTYRITGKLDVKIFMDTWQLIVQRHDIFRSIFVYENVPKPIQIVLKEREMPIEVIDISDLAKEKIASKIQEEILLDRSKSFHLTKDNLMRMKIIKCDNETYEIIWSSHHILMDGWSLGVILNEFFVIYKSKQKSISAKLNTPLSYGEYIKYLKTVDQKSALRFWRQYLKNYYQQMRIPYSFDSDSSQYEPGEINFEINENLSNVITQMAQENQITLSSLLQSIWSLVLWQLNSLETQKIDVAFGVTVAGRPAEINGVSEIVGLFINTIPCRFRGNITDSFISYARACHESTTETKPYHYSSLAEIQNESDLKQKLFDHIFVFENYPLSADEETGKDIGLIIDNFNHFDFTNYGFTLQVAPSKSLGFKFLYNKKLYEASLIHWVEAQVKTLIEQFSLHSDKSIQSILLSSNPDQKDLFSKYNLKNTFGNADEYRKLLISKGLLIENIDIQSIVISASFTAEPMEASLRWWLQRHKIAKNITFAPYNQIFQQCFDRESQFSRNTGENVILLRVADWVREIENDSAVEAQSVLKSNLQLFEEALKNRAGTGKLFVFILPYNESVYPSNLNEIILEISNSILLLNETIIGVSVFDLRPDLPYYQIGTLYDAKQDEMGHIPFSLEGFHCIGTAIARKIVSFLKPAFKVIVVDCDDTLWDGVVGEIGVEKIRVDEPYLLFQQFLLSKYDSGFLLAMCSKNNEADVLEVFKKNGKMLLKLEHFATWRINWGAKSANIKSMAEELNLGLNSFVYWDDSAMECAEVMGSCPEIFTIRFPKFGKNIKHYLYHTWAFDQFRITDEDRKRNEMVKEENQRNQAMNSMGTMENFLKQLQLKVSIYELVDQTPMDIWVRASQLTFRTNQFNLNTKRRSEPELIDLVKNKNHRIWMVQVEDRFGQYGWVGLIIGVSKSAHYFVDTFLLSCRVLARGVEHALLDHLAQVAFVAGNKTLQLNFRPSEKNMPMEEFLEKITWDNKLVNSSDTIFELALPTENYRQNDLVIEILKELPVNKVNENINKEKPVILPPKEKEILVQQEDTLISFELTSQENLIHIAYYDALFYHSAKKISLLPLYETKSRRLQNSLVPAVGAEEIAMVKIWCELLSIDEVGVTDNFFALGGHSLLATRLISNISQNYSKTLNLKEFYENPEIRLLLQFLHNKNKEVSKIEKVVEAQYYPLSFSQKRLWALQHLDERSFAYNTPNNYLIDGSLQIPFLQKAFESLVERHEAFRTRFIVCDGVPFQKIYPIDTGFFKNLEMPESQIEGFLRDECERPFDLENENLFRVRLIRIGFNRHILHINMHHIISDGWSMEILEKEVAVMYEAFVKNMPNPLLPIIYQYKDFSAWHNKVISESDKKNELKEFWLQQLSGDLPTLELPLDFKRPVIQTHRGKICRFEFSKQHSQLLITFGKNNACGYFTVLQALLNVLIYKITSQKDIIIGAPVSGRNHSEFHQTVGFFVNTIALRNKINPTEDFLALVRQIDKTFAEAYDHQFYPFDLLIENLELERDFSRSPIFDIFTSFQKAESLATQPSFLQIQNYSVPIEISRFDLMFHFQESANLFYLDITYNTDLFLESTIHRIFSYFSQLLSTALVESHKKIGSYSLLNQNEIRNLFAIGGVDTYKGIGLKHQTIIGAFNRFIKLHANYCAVSDKGGELTYQELDHLSTNLAKSLMEAGIKKSDVVACLIPKSNDLLIALLGIMKAGGVYLPVDITLPEARVEYILNDSQCKICLTSGFSRKQTISKNCLFINWNEALITNPNEFILPVIFGNDLAYMIYTSGSTGLPKGVLLKHDGFVNMCYDQIKLFDVNSQDRVLWFASPSFDASLSEIFMAFLSGAKLVIPSKETIADTSIFEALLKSENISILTLPPVYLHQLNFNCFKSVKTLITAGEAPILSDIKVLAHRLRYFNAYGPTEASVCATAFRVSDEYAKINEIIPIGKPINGLAIVLLDENNELVPKGLRGQIAIAGIGLAHSYYNKPDLTAEKFIYSEVLKDRLYLTGDVGYWDHENQLIFIGRIDDQVKIRGHRIELNEINTTIVALGLAEEVETLVWQNQGEATLVCFLLKSKETSFDKIREKLVSQLPHYMIPHSFVFLSEFPVNQNGKIDKEKLLKEYNPTLIDSIKSEPTNETEKELYEQLMGVLKTKELGIDDSFFDLGGDSIRAIQYVSKLRQCGYQLSSKQVFMYPTIRQLAKTLTDKTKNSVEVLVNYAGELLLSPIQAWFFETFHETKHHFNHSEIFVCKERMDAEILNKVVLALSMKHEILRAVCVGKSMQILKECPQGAFRSISYDGQLSYENCILEVQSSIDLYAGPLWKIVLLRKQNEDQVLFCFHHLVIDGVSWRILLDDFTDFYLKLKAQKDISVLPVLGFHHWTEKIHQMSRDKQIITELPYWNEFNKAEYIQVPCNSSSTKLTIKQTKAVKISFSESETSLILKELLSQLNCNINELLLGSLARALAVFRNEPNTLIMMEGHGRNDNFVGDLDLSQTVGWFTNAFPFLLEKVDGSFENQVQKIRSLYQQLPNHGLGYGILKYITPKNEKVGDLQQFKPMVSFNYLGQYDGVENHPFFRSNANAPDFSNNEDSPLLYSLNINGIIQRSRMEFYFAYHEIEYSNLAIQKVAELFKFNITEMLSK